MSLFITDVKKQEIYLKNERDQHFLSIMRRAGLYSLKPKDIRLERAFSTKELYGAYSLVHDQYVAKKYVHPLALGMRIRNFELSDNMATFVVKKENLVIGVCSLIVDSKELSLPCDKIYGDQLKKMRSKSRLLCEATNQALHKEFYGSTALTELLRCVLAQALYKGCDKMMIEVSKSHKKFYELNYFIQVGTIQNYSDELYTPVILMCLDMVKLLATFNSTDEESHSVNAFMKQFYYSQNPYLQHVKKWDSYKGIQAKNTLKLMESLQKRSNRTED